MEIAVATNTHPGPWFDEEPETIATVLDVLDRQAERLEKNKKRRR